jgi:hypothetical protein
VAALMRQLIQLCLLRIGPQDLPYSPTALAGLATALISVQALFGVSQGLPALGVAMRAFVTAFLLFTVTARLLRWRGFGNRTLQTQLALAGTGLLFALAMLPTAMALMPHAGNPEPPASVMPFALVAIVLFFWKLRVDAAIWLQALELRPGQAYALAVALLLAEALLVLLLVPPVPAAAAS